MLDVDKIRKINKNIIHEDGTIDSFDKQLIQLTGGTFDTRYPMLINTSAMSLAYIDELNTSLPLVINTSTVIKLKDKHNLGYAFVAEIDYMLKESVMAFDSIVHSSSIIVVLDKVNELEGDPIIAICRTDKKVAVTSVNEITSIYDKQNLQNLMIKSYEKGAKFYKTSKTKAYCTSIGFYFPQDMQYALSDNYNKTSFNKNQVELDLLDSFVIKS